ncbi:MAG: SPOR domain-containing protein [Pseudomonadota bacterium]
MRDLEKIKSKRVYNIDKGKISLILATGIAIGVVVFVIGLLLGLKKPAEAQASSLDPLEALVAESEEEARQAEKSEAGSVSEIEEVSADMALEYASRLGEDVPAGMAPQFIHAMEGDEPMPIGELSAEPVIEPVSELPAEPVQVESVIPKGSHSFMIPASPAEVAYMEPPRSTMSMRGEKGIFTLHVNSFTDKQDGAAYAKQLRKMGYNAFLVAADCEDRGTIYRVRIGPFFSKNEAEKFRMQFERKEGLPTYVVKRILLEV